MSGNIGSSSSAGVNSSPQRRAAKGRPPAPLVVLDASYEGRPTCYRCIRPMSYCVCGFIEPFRAHCNLLILQHPNERKKYYSTIKLLRSGVTNARVLQGVVFREGVLEQALAGQKVYVLFPGAGAVDAQEVELGLDSTVVVLDGTWSEAGKILRRNPLLSQLPQISFRTAITSTYRIRKQPKPHCLSSLESVAHLLMQNAAAQGQCDSIVRYKTLLSGFDRMVEQQLRNFPRFRQRSDEMD